jgi:hypothetical protein
MLVELEEELKELLENSPGAPEVNDELLEEMYRYYQPIKEI